MITLVAGLPGSGKSTLAQKLAERLDAIYINSGQVRLALQASGKYSPEEKLVIYKEMLLQTARAVEENRDVVVDATFYHHTLREMFLRLASGYNLPIRVIEVEADEKLIKERFGKQAKGSAERYAVYEKVRDDFEEITMPHLTLQSTDDNLDFMLKKAISYIATEVEQSL